MRRRCKKKPEKEKQNREMVSTPGSSSVTAASKPPELEHVWHTCCFHFIFPALPLQGLQALFSHHFPAGCSELFLRSPTDPKAKISLLNFLSEFSKFSLELSILPAKRRKSTHSSLEWVSPQCFQHTLLPGRSSRGASKHFITCNPQPSHFWKTTSTLNGRLSRAFFFFKRSGQDKEPKTLQLLFCSLFLTLEEIT